MKLKPTHIFTAGASALALTAGAAQADIVHADDVIIQFSLCVGNDCVNGESFSFDTIRLKENNLRIHFQDTSSSASFPTNDWRIVANDTSNGGTNHLSIEDSNAGRTPFRVEAGASANALVIEADSDIGIGTLNPVVEVHVVDGDSPTLRLEQDGTSGFTPQTFDLVSNESNFFIRDVTNGSQLPFRIKPGADSDSLFIAADNDIGIGTDNPGTLTFGTNASLHVRRTNGNASVLVEEASGTAAARVLAELRNNGNTILALTNTAGTAHTWNIQNRGSSNNNELRIVNSVGTGEELILSADGNLTITGAITTTGGTCGTGCDAVFTEDYDLPSIAEHTQAMYNLGYLPNVGPTIENQPINLSDKVGRMLNELEHAHIYIAQLNDKIEELETRLEASD